MWRKLLQILKIYLTLPLEKKMQFAAPRVENKVDRQYKDIKDGPSRSQFSKRVIFSLYKFFNFHEIENVSTGAASFIFLIDANINF